MTSDYKLAFGYLGIGSFFILGALSPHPILLVYLAFVIFVLTRKEETNDVS